MSDAAGEVPRAPQVRVGQSPVRCPYCHDDVDASGDAWVACRACLARHHPDCWVEACGACGERSHLAPAAPPVALARAAPGGPLAPAPAAPGRVTLREALQAGRAAYARPGAVTLMGAGLFAGIVGSMFFPLAPFLSAGLWTIALRQQRGQVARFEDVFAGGPRFLAVTLAGLVLSLAFVLGLAALVVPGLWLATVTCYVTPLITDRGLSVSAAVRESARRVRGAGVRAHLGLLLLDLVVSLLLSVPVLGHVLNALLRPLIFGAFAWAYRRAGGEDGAPDPRSSALGPGGLEPRALAKGDAKDGAKEDAKGA